MESLNPLKWMGGLALLCLALYLAVPDGRLNSFAALRAMGFPRYSPQTMYKGELAEFHRLGADTEIIADGRHADQFFRREAYVQAAIDSGEVDVIGVAVRNGTPATFQGTTSGIPKGDQARIRSLYGKCQEAAELGRAKDPGNSFFPLMLAVIADAQGESGKAEDYLLTAAKCERYENYAQQEVDRRMGSLVYEPSAMERLSNLAMVLFKDLSPIRTLCRKWIAGDREKTVKQRLAVIAIGKTMLEPGGFTITQVVGKSLIAEAVSKSVSESIYKSKLLSLEQVSDLTRAAEGQGLHPGNQFEQALHLSQYSYSIDGNAALDFDVLYLASPLLCGLPLPVLLVTATVVTLLLATQRFADRAWVKPIRYLALVPLSVSLAATPTAFSFHVPTVVTILLVSLPIALISITERFVPVIHVTIVAIALYFFERNTALEEVLGQVALMAALVILAWHKNRKPETKFSRFLSIALLLASLGLAMAWMPAALGGAYSGQTGIASLPLILACLCLSTLAIVDADRQLARRQALVAASLGLALFAGACYASLQASNRLAGYQKHETAYSQLLHEDCLTALNGGKPANKTLIPSVESNR